MTIELKIFPTIKPIISWGIIKKKLYGLLSPTEQQLPGEHPLLLELGSNQKVADDVQLSLGGYYYLSLVIPNTLGIAVMSKADDFDEENLEWDYLEDYGHNLDLKEIQILAERWRVAAHFYGVTSMGGRSKHESRLFVALATAIAYTCAGYVCVMENSLFDLRVGVYTPGQFQCAEPKF